MRKIFIIFCCGLLLLTDGCGQKDEVAPTISQTTVTSEIKKTEEEKPPTVSQPTETSSSASTTTTTEKEKEDESEPTNSTESKLPTTPPKTETTVTEKPKPTENTSSTIEQTETSSAEEIYNAQPYVDTVDIEKLVVKYINEYRVAQGDTVATTLPGLTEVARYRVKQLVTDFLHNSIPNTCNVLRYGEFIDMTLYGGTAEESYYRGYNREAIGKGSWFGTAEQMAHRIANGFYKSKSHWNYVGSSEYTYIAVGVEYENNNWYVCVCMSHTNYGE